MASHRIEVALLPELADAEGAAAAAGLRAAGAAGVSGCRVVRVFSVSGAIGRVEIERLASELLADKVVDTWAADAPVLDEKGLHSVEIARKPGVMEPSEQSIKRGAAALGIPVDEVWTAKRYLVDGDVDSEELLAAARRVLMNDVIEFATAERLPAERPHPAGYAFRLVTVPLETMSDAEMLETSRRMVLSLNLEEMKAVRDHFRSLGRSPTDVELSKPSPRPGASTACTRRSGG